MAVNLTPNAIAAINGGDVNSKPLVQVLDIKLIGTGTVLRAPLRRRFILARHARHSAQQLCHLRSSPQRLHHPSNNFRYFLFLS